MPSIGVGFLYEAVEPLDGAVQVNVHVYREFQYPDPHVVLVPRRARAEVKIKMKLKLALFFWCGRRDSNPGCQLSPRESWGAEVIPGWIPPQKRPRPPD